jgi:DNA-binding LacI/PurR family transcriptional regulator
MTDLPHAQPPQRRLTMEDIARLAGVSASTVSRSLAGSKLIPMAMRNHVIAIARENGYVLNRAARSLRLYQTHTISLVLPRGPAPDQEITDPFLLEMIGRISQEVIARGYDLLMTRITNPEAGWLNDLVQSNRFDGVLVLGQSHQHDILNAVAKTYRPMVVWGEHLDGQAYTSVGVDNMLAGAMATQHLFDTGRRHIRFFGPSGVPEADARYIGYRRAMEHNNLGVANLERINAEFLFESGQSAMEALLASGEPFDAVFAASDVVAHGAKTTFLRAGGRVPEDVAFCGFDDVAMAKYLTPPLTTVRQDLQLAARRMVELLFRRMSGEEAPSERLPAELIIRGSSQPYADR